MNIFMDKCPNFRWSDCVETPSSVLESAILVIGAVDTFSKYCVPCNTFISACHLTSNPLEQEQDLARVEVAVLVPGQRVVLVPALGRHGHAGLHVVGLQVGEGELVGQAVHGVQVERADGVPVTVCSILVI